MATGATSLSVVREELFATMTETQQNLERFLEERDSGTLLQRSVHNLQQIKGILSLIGLTGAELLAQEMQVLAMDIPAGANEQCNDQLSAINNGLHVLHSYLEHLEANWIEMPELLLPAINQLRVSASQSQLPESYFFSTRLTIERPSRPPLKSLKDPQSALNRLRHLYQLALLSVIKEKNVQQALAAMKKLVQEMDVTDPAAAGTIIYWVSAAALESVIDGKLLLTTERKLLFSRLDREIKQHLSNASHSPSRGLIKDMLYLVALAYSPGPCAVEVQRAANLPTLPFTDRMLADEYRRMSGPGTNVLRSLSAAIQEELGMVKDTVDLIGRGTASDEAFENLPLIIAKLEKTLIMVGQTGASLSLKRQLKTLAGWKTPQDVSSDELLQLADAVIYIEGLVASLEMGQRHAAKVAELSEAEVFARHQLLEAQIIIKDEATNGLLLAKRSITSYFESGGDVNHLRNLPDALTLVRGGLWFVNEKRAGQLVQLCADYIENSMLNADHMPSESALETLADVLASLEYYLEGGIALQTDNMQDTLDTAASGLGRLGIQITDVASAN
ncbi:MAG: ferrous iron transporter B [Gammaproteobacteria bacterium]|nr:ferrous iron transporter B [Gammaproteobacteria bacterium]